MTTPVDEHEILDDPTVNIRPDKEDPPFVDPCPTVECAGDTIEGFCPDCDYEEPDFE